MSKAKWFVARKPSTGEIIAKSANQIVPQKISLRYKNVVLYSESPDPPFSSWRVEGGSRYETKVVVTRQALQSETTVQEPGLFSYAMLEHLKLGITISYSLVNIHKKCIIPNLESKNGGGKMRYKCNAHSYITCVNTSFSCIP